MNWTSTTAPLTLAAAGCDPGGGRARTQRPPAAADLAAALDALPVPAFALDRHGRFSWLNRGAVDAIGDRVGDHLARAVAEEDAHSVRSHVARALIGEAASTEYEATLV